MKALKATFFPLFLKKYSSQVQNLSLVAGLSLSSIMEAAFCCVAMKDQFLPGSAHVQNPDPELGHLELLQESKDYAVNRILSNSSGFGGANVSVISKSLMSDLTSAILNRRTTKPSLYSDRIPDPEIIKILKFLHAPNHH